MTRTLPERTAVDKRRHDFIIAPRFILITKHRDEAVVNDSTMRQHEGTAGANFVKGEKRLLATEHTMVTLACLFGAVCPVHKAILIRKGGAVHTLSMESTVKTSSTKCLETTPSKLGSTGHMRAAAKIDELTHAIGREPGVGSEALNHLELTLVVPEHISRNILGKLKAFKGCSFLQDFVGNGIDVFDILWSDPTWVLGIVCKVKVVEKSALARCNKARVNCCLRCKRGSIINHNILMPKFCLKCMSKNMCTRMPKCVSAFR
mmetsp:Transcript_8823/g.17449  ORF Transcript_8823/g.17449 Transcript_8823/m.17449 type:complete len:262 (-) Transcript_8823:583-1368(-)